MNKLAQEKLLKLQNHAANLFQLKDEMLIFDYQVCEPNDQEKHVLFDHTENGVELSYWKLDPKMTLKASNDQWIETTYHSLVKKEEQPEWTP